MFPVKNDFTEARLNRHCPLWATMERNTTRFMAAGENGVNPTCLMPQESKGWKLVWGNEKPICCRLHQPGPCLTPRNGTTVSPLAPCHPAEAGFSSACGSYVHSSVRSVSLWIGCGMVQSQGLLWIMKKSFLFWLSGLKSLMGGLPLRFFLFVCFICLFFLSLCIAASGLHENCWVCMHFNK